MKMLKTLGLTLTTSAFLAGCGSPSSESTEAAPGSRFSAVQSDSPVVRAAASGQSACNAAYSDSQAQAALTQAQVDPGLKADGQLKTLILSFNTAQAVAPALNVLKSLPGLTVGQNLGSFKSLPMVVLKAPVTPGLLASLKSSLQPLGLLSIYQDKPLHYFLDKSVHYIGADTARESFGISGEGVGVAIIDSGCDGTHLDLTHVAKNVKTVASPLDQGVGGALYVDVPNSDLAGGHGTHVTSTIGGSGAASGGKYKGVAPGASLVCIGSGDGLSILFALQGFDYVLNPTNREAYNIRVVSNSWGTSGSHFAPFDPISIATRRAYDAKMVVAFAAGNDGPDADTLNPYSASPCVMSVAAGTAKDTSKATNPLLIKALPGQLADFSSRGVPGDANHHPDITLPGVAIVAARATSAVIAQPYTGEDNAHPEPLYAALDGTSMATPHASGVAALMLQVNPSLNLDGVLALLTATARPMYVQDATTQTSRQLAVWEAGAGYADAYAAIRAAAQSAGTRYTTSTSALPGWTGSVGTAVNAPEGVTLANAQDTHALSVPPGASTLRVKTDWGNPGDDLDLSVYDPSGNLVGTSATGTSSSEAVSIPHPVAGTWSVVLKGYLNAPTSYTGTAEVDTLVPVPQQ